MKVIFSSQLKVMGNHRFGERFLPDAVEYYDLAVLTLRQRRYDINGTLSADDEALELACLLNRARSFLKLQDEDRCLIACAEAELLAKTRDEAQRQGNSTLAVKSEVASVIFVRAQLHWLLSAVSDQYDGPPVGNGEQQRRLQRARADLRLAVELSSPEDKSDRSYRILLRSVQEAIKQRRR